MNEQCEVNDEAVIERIKEIMADGDTKDVEAYLRTVYKVSEEGAIEVSDAVKDTLLELMPKQEVKEEQSDS